MNAPLRMPTPTALAAHKRRVAFQQKIDEAARALRSREADDRCARSDRYLAAMLAVTEAADLQPEAMPAEPDPPMPTFAYPPMSRIIEAVARYYRISMMDMRAARRTLAVVLPRQVAMYLCRTLTPHSLPAIGRQMGGRDHTTVLHGCRKIEAKMRSEAEFAFEVAGLIEHITGSNAE